MIANNRPLGAMHGQVLQPARAPVLRQLRGVNSGHLASACTPADVVRSGCIVPSKEANSHVSPEPYTLLGQRVLHHVE